MIQSEYIGTAKNNNLTEVSLLYNTLDWTYEL